MPVDSLGHFAPDCSSWGMPARGTSLRSFLNWQGNVHLAWVQRANQQVARNLGWTCFETALGQWDRTLQKESLTAKDNSCDIGHAIQKHGMGSGAASELSIGAASSVRMVVQLCWVCALHSIHFHFYSRPN